MGTGASKVYLIHQHYLLRVTIWWVHFTSTLLDWTLPTISWSNWSSLPDDLYQYNTVSCKDCKGLDHLPVSLCWLHACTQGSWGGGGGTHQLEVCVICVMTSRDKVATWFTLYIMIHPVLWITLYSTVPHNVSVMSAAPGLEPGWETLRPLNPFMAVIIWATYNDSKCNF